MDKARYLVEAHLREVVRWQSSRRRTPSTEHREVIRQLTLDPTRDYQPLGVS